MKIGELARQTGLPVETLRFYERQGLLQARRADNGYRLFALSDVARVQFILRAKQLGFSLEDIGELLELEQASERHSCQEVKDLAEAKLADIEGRLRELQLMHGRLRRIADSCCGGPQSAAECTILGVLIDGELRAECHGHEPGS